MTINKYIILALSILTFAGCSSDDDFSQEQSRLPLTFETSLSGSRSVTRAVGGSFDTGDELLCYVRHIYSTDLSTDKNYLEVDPYKKLVTIIDGEPTEKLYWDDFSDNNSDGHYLRTANHALQSFYGYCYNGGEPTTKLVNATGVLGWTTDNDQTTVGDMKKNDLLWSPAQNPVTYVHAKENREGLSIPYTHAMSKFTIVVVAGEGFEADDLNNATVTLKDMNKVGTFTAPTSTVEATGTTDVRMYANAVTTTEGKTSRAYEAVSVPLVSLTTDKLLATINNVDGNNYEVYLTDAILTAWTDGIKENKSQSGINYKLTITLKKQTITVVATLADWTDVSATGTGEINFTADVKTIDKVNDTSLKGGDSFSLWRTADKKNFGAIATTAEYDGSKFVNTPAIYWANGSTSYYFRALAKKTDSKTLDAVTTFEANQDIDLLWGTTAAHKGYLADNTEVPYAEGAAINPRTGNVPLVFKHAMSKVVISLETTNDASAVDLTGAKVTLTSLANEGTIDLESGVVTASTTKVEEAVNASTSFDNLIMVPQTIGNDAKLIITLDDNGTTYSLQLNQCTDGTGTAITTWTGGNKYTYTISLKKEQIQFRALVQDWVSNTGSGNATLDWD